MHHKFLVVFTLLLGLLPVLHAGNEEPQNSDLKALADRVHYQTGRVVLGDQLATINLTEKFLYVDPAGTDIILTGLWGNPPSSTKSMGMIVPKGFSPLGEDAWCIVITYNDDGHISDEDAGKINYSNLLKDMQKAIEKANPQRKKDGYPEMQLVGWAATPHYDAATHKMFWAKELSFAGSQGKENTLNYNFRLLGRQGVLVLNAIAGMQQLQAVEQATPEILSMVDFNPGQRYADYQPGTDKLATYGLAAMVAGGVIAKTGLLKTIMVGLLAMKKFVILGVLAVAAWLKNLFGKKKDTP